MNRDLKKIEKLLDESHIPREVWIGTDSIVDRVEWLIKRNILVEERAKKRFKLCAVCEEKIKT